LKFILGGNFMKFKFYYKGNKSKTQTIKCDNKDSLMKILTIAKAELLKKNILKDIDFTDNKLMCKVDGKIYNMKELWNTFSTYKSNTTKNKDKKSKQNKHKKNKKKNKKVIMILSDLHVYLSYLQS
jgi:hypothetical protein